MEKYQASRDWKKRNPEKAREQVRRWRERNPEKSKENQRRSYERNKERHKAQGLQWRRDNPEAAYDIYLRHTYGAPAGTYARLMAEQDGKCAICGKTDPGRKVRGNADKRFCLDHDHSTGSIRGLLCYSCNTAIGHLGDNPEKLRAATAYLLKYLPQPNAPVPDAEDSILAPNC